MTRRLLRHAAGAGRAVAALGFAGQAGARSAPAAPRPSRRSTAVTNDDCFSCHGVRGKTPSITVDGRAEEPLRRPVRVRALAPRQAGLHELPHRLQAGHRTTPARPPPGCVTAKLTACGNCHADEFAMYRGSFHGNLVFGHVQRQGARLRRLPRRAQHRHAGHGRPSAQSIACSARAVTPQAAKTYLDSYHGKAFYLGDANTAVCTDCHGGHKILPPSNPASTVSSQNIVATCAKCHPGANANFAGFLVHVDPSSPKLVVLGVDLLHPATSSLIAVRLHVRLRAHGPVHLPGVQGWPLHPPPYRLRPPHREEGAHAHRVPAVQRLPPLDALPRLRELHRARLHGHAAQVQGDRTGRAGSWTCFGGVTAAGVYHRIAAHRHGLLLDGRDDVHGRHGAAQPGQGCQRPRLDDVQEEGPGGHDRHVRLVLRQGPQAAVRPLRLLGEVRLHVPRGRHRDHRHRPGS